jgi:preprotein translocase subunit YajC
MWMFLGFMLLLLIVPNLLTGRQNKKRQNERSNMLNGLKPGDEVITIGGFYGKIDSVGNDFFLIKFSQGETVAKIKKEAIASAAGEPSAPAQTASVEEEDDDIYAPLEEETDKKKK